MTLCVALASAAGAAQVNLELGLIGPTGRQPTGAGFPVKINYRSASATSAAVNPVLEVALPPGMRYEAHESSPDIASAVYDGSRGVMVFTFKSPLAAGVSGQLGLTLRFENGTTPDYAVQTLKASFDAANAARVEASESVTAEATSRFRVQKYVHSGGAIDAETSYAIQVCNGTYALPENGTLDLTDVVLDDLLPAGATFVRFTYPSDVPDRVGSYDPATRRARITIDRMRPGECVWTRIVVRYDQPANAVGDVKANTVEASATPLGQGPESANSTTTHTLTEPSGSSVTYKTASRTQMFAGDYAKYEIWTQNDGTRSIEGYAVVDELPTHIRIQSVTTGSYEQDASLAPPTLTLQYKTNLNGAWRNWSAPGLSIYEFGTYSLSDIGLFDGGPEWPTAVRWAFAGTVAPGFTTWRNAEINFKLAADAPATVMSNCAVGTSSSTGIDHTLGCAFISTKRPELGTVHTLFAALLHGYNNPFAIGDEAYVRARMGNGSTATDPVLDPVMAVLLPEGVELLPGSYEKLYSPEAAGVPSFSVSENHAGTGRTLLLARYEAPGAHIPPDKHEWIQFGVRITAEAEAGTTPADIQVFMFGREPADKCWSSEDYVDALDLDGDGDRAEEPCNTLLGLFIDPFTAASSVLEVKGSLDAAYSTYPDAGITLPGGIADYRLTVSNDGNTVLDQVAIIDVLPAVGDRGVVDTRERHSRWRPHLVGPVAAPAGVTVYYSTVGNPCRDAAGFGAVNAPGCQPADWSVVPPADITSVAALKMEMPDRALGIGESVRIEWPMRTPTTVLTSASPGEIAWNSAGFTARVQSTGAVLLPTEPIKTGISIAPLQPGVVGDRVWSDANDDGIQQGGEGPVNGVRVNLYRDNGDGVAEPDADQFVSYTVTSGDGNYLFPALPTGNYFLLYEVAPTYKLGRYRQGSDRARDSDGQLTYSNGRVAAVTPVFAISDTQFDLDRDLALVPTGTAAVGDYVWHDADGDGRQNEGALAGVNGVTVRLLNAVSGAEVATTRTRTDFYGNPGAYRFDQLAPGDYRLQIVTPAQTTLSAHAQGGNASADSDGDPGDAGRTRVLTLAADTYERSIDFGLQLSGTEECDNGIDDDGNGLVDCEDPACSTSPLCAPRFACDNTLYQTITIGTDLWLYRVDVSPVGLTPVADLTAAGVTHEVNSTVLNPRDGYIYVLAKFAPYAIYRIAGDMSVEYLGDATAPAGASGFNAGAVDRDGNWLVRAAGDGNFYTVDPVSLTISLRCSFPDAPWTANVGDIEFNPVDGYYYGTVHDTDQLYRYDFAACTRTPITLSRTIVGSTGAFWISADGVGYGYANQSGELLRIDLTSGAVTSLGFGSPTLNTDGCSCQGLQLNKDITTRTLRKGDTYTYEFTVANRYFGDLTGVQFFDQLPVGARFLSAPYATTGGLAFTGVSGVGSRTLSARVSNFPSIASSFKIDFVVDPSYSGAHPMPNQAEWRDLPVGIGTNILSDDPQTPAVGDATLVDFYEHCDNGVDDDVDGYTDCDDGECPGGQPVLRVQPN